jgi:hypothetical protein
MVRAMKFRMYAAVIASLSAAAALMLAASETLARSGSAPRGAFASTHPIPHLSGAHGFRHHRRSGVPFWPAVGGFVDGPSGEPIVDAAQPVSGNLHYTYSYDVPWDWTHRYPLTLPSDRPYVPSCGSEIVTVPGRDGGEHTVNVMRCY